MCLAKYDERGIHRRTKAKGNMSEETTQDYGPQKRPASVNQLEAQMKSVVSDFERDSAGYLKERVDCDRHGFYSWMRGCPYCENDRIANAISFIRDDSIAMTYQTMGQYRTAILNVLEGKE